jgi:hypothetical protein
LQSANLRALELGVVALCIGTAALTIDWAGIISGSVKQVHGDYFSDRDRYCHGCGSHHDSLPDFLVFHVLTSFFIKNAFKV